MNVPDVMQVFEPVREPALRPFVRRFMVVGFPSHYRDTHLPDTGPVMAFSLQGECRLEGDRLAPRAAFTGLYDRLRSHEHCQGHTVLLATFTPAGAAAFLRPPLEEFTGTTVDLADILGHPRELDRLQDRLGDAPNDRERVLLIEDFLLVRARSLEPDLLVSAAVSWLEQRAGSGRIADMAQHIGLSQSALERRFRRVVGLSPKRFASVIRLRQAVKLRTTGQDFTNVALAAGYFDQAHFIKDFRRATGSAPEAFFRRTSAG